MWEEEQCSHCIVANTKDDLKEPLFVALDNDEIVGYIFGYYYKTDRKTSYIEIGSYCLMIDELYNANV